MNVGKYNFDEIRYEYYRDATVLLEAFKGDRIDFRVGEQRPQLGDGLQLSRRASRAASSSRNSPPAPPA